MATVHNENENNDIKTLIRIGYGIKFDVSLLLASLLLVKVVMNECLS